MEAGLAKGMVRFIDVRLVVRTYVAAAAVSDRVVFDITGGVTFLCFVSWRFLGFSRPRCPPKVSRHGDQEMCFYFGHVLPQKTRYWGKVAYVGAVDVSSQISSGSSLRSYRARCWA